MFYFYIQSLIRYFDLVLDYKKYFQIPRIKYHTMSDQVITMIQILDCIKQVENIFGWVQEGGWIEL